MTEQATIAIAATQTESEATAADPLAQPEPVGAHLVGSVPLGRVDEVLRRTAEALGDRLRRLPDGEPGPRSDWILWQYPVFSALPQFEVGPPGDGTYRTLPKLRLRDGERAADIVLGNLGFADAALSSFAIFAKLKRDRVIPAHVRFQVSLPTPLAPVSAFIDPEHQAQVEPIYEAQVLRELDEIFAAVPHDQLALQWDTRLEFAILEGVSPAWFEEPAPAFSSGSCGSAAACPPMSSWASISATATTITGTSPFRTTRASSSRWRTRSRRRCTGR